MNNETESLKSTGVELVISCHFRVIKKVNFPNIHTKSLIQLLILYNSIKGQFHDPSVVMLCHSSVDRQYELISKFPGNSEVAFVSYGCFTVLLQRPLCMRFIMSTE